jgi:hypothetical protein
MDRDVDRTTTMTTILRHLVVPATTTVRVGGEQEGRDRAAGDQPCGECGATACQW